jgi:hypothetical protein
LSGLTPDSASRSIASSSTTGCRVPVSLDGAAFFATGVGVFATLVASIFFKSLKGEKRGSFSSLGGCWARDFFFLAMTKISAERR